MPAHRTKENQGIVATESRHTVEGMARGEKKKEKPKEGKKRKSPKIRKSPQQKKRNRCLRLRLLTGGCAAHNPLTPPLASRCLALASLASYGRLRRPLLFLLSPLPSAAAPPPFLALSALLSPLVGGCAAPPLCFSSRASYGRLRRPTPSAFLPLLRRLRRLSLPRALVGGWRRPLSPLSLSSLSNNYQTFNAVTCHKFFFFCHFFKRLRINYFSELFCMLLKGIYLFLLFNFISQFFYRW